MLNIVQAQMPECASDVRQLFAEYLESVNSMLRHEYGLEVDITSMLEDDMTVTGPFFRPGACLLLAEVDGRVAGCACMRQIGGDAGEIKRMYVRPALRGQGIGRALLESALERARQAGLTTMRLDSAGFMKEAQTLYRSVGFRQIEAYPENLIPAQFQQHWVFMEKSL